tara:strand:+ start:320 stop:562 length:243 start_codon:yes stop_codon:yes gene_type:complete
VAESLLLGAVAPLTVVLRWVAGLLLLEAAESLLLEAVAPLTVVLRWVAGVEWLSQEAVAPLTVLLLLGVAELMPLGAGLQ